MVGDTLHRLLRERIGVNTIAKCCCDEKRDLMNAQGSAWCRENIDWIVGGLLDEAKKRRWKIDGKPLLSLAAKYGTILPWGMAYARAWARSLVTEAIEICERTEEPTGA